MKLKSIALIFAGTILFAACGGQSQKNDAELTPATATPDLQRTWFMTAVSANDTAVLRPAEIDPGHPQKFTFAADGSFAVNTNCNTLGGEYTLSGDSIAMTNILTTEMACDNMDVEQMLLGLLPVINRVEVVNDSTIRLTAPEASAYVELTSVE